MSIEIKQPDEVWLNSYLEPSLIETNAYSIDTPDVKYKLDQNESPFDWPESLKQKILNLVMKEKWNNYPPSYATNLEKLVASYANVPHDCVMLAPGSNHLVAITMSLFSKKIKGKVIIARPSFALYESHCHYEGIPYEAWELNDQLQYDEQKLPKVTSGSLIVFASPNNPVGNVLEKQKFKELLSKYADSLFIADEAYFEFAKEPYTDLLKDHSNLIIIRTFSKTMGAAGIRLGYLVAHSAYIKQLKKVMLPFMVNQFTLVAASEVLKDQDARKLFAGTVEQTIKERDNLYNFLSAVGKTKGFEVVNSQANFLLLRWPTNELAHVAYQKIIKGGVLPRDVSKGPGLAGCIRITIGDYDANKAVMEIFKNL